MQNFFRTLKLGFIPAVVIGLFIKTGMITVADIDALLPADHKWPWLLALIILFLGMIYACGRGTDKIALILGMFFKNLGSEAIYGLDYGARKQRMVVVGEIIYGAAENHNQKTGGISYCVCYRASFLRLLVDAPEEIKKSELNFTGRTAAEALFSSSMFMSDLINQGKQKKDAEKSKK